MIPPKVRQIWGVCRDYLTVRTATIGDCAHLFPLDRRRIWRVCLFPAKSLFFCKLGGEKLTIGDPIEHGPLYSNVIWRSVGDHVKLDVTVGCHLRQRVLSIFSTWSKHDNVDPLKFTGRQSLTPRTRVRAVNQIIILEIVVDLLYIVIR